MYNRQNFWGQCFPSFLKIYKKYESSFILKPVYLRFYFLNVTNSLYNADFKKTPLSNVV